MQYSIVNYSDIDLGDRIDAEYFQPIYLHIEEKLVENHAIPLRNFCSITGSAFYPAATHLYETGDLPFIRCVDCISYPIITSRQNALFEKIPRDFADEHKNVKRLSKGEIVITKVGTPCYASIIHDLEKVALSRTVLGLKSITNIDPYYLVAFLRSKYGFVQLLRERELTIQFQLTFDRVGNVLIFKPADNKLEKRISNCFLLHEAINRQSEQLYAQAQNFLLSELGLTDWQPQHRLTFVTNYSEMEQAERIDADYYQPKYEEIDEVLIKLNAKPIRSYRFLDVTTGQYCPDYVASDEGRPYLRGTDLTVGSIAMESLCYIKPEDQVPSKQAQEGDVVVTRVGTVGLSARIPKECDGGTISDNLIRVRILDRSKIDSYYLSCFLGSEVGKSLMLRNARGSVQQRLNQETLKEILLPIPEMEVQSKIKDTIIESFNLRQQSKHLLDCAKRAAEIAIEQDEQTAIDYLEKETQVEDFWNGEVTG